MKKRKVLVSLLCASALLGVSAGALTSCKKADEQDNPTPEVQKFTVTFDSKGGSQVAKGENIESGAKIAKPDDPTKEGYDFGGWYKTDPKTDANAVAWNFASDTVTENVTLYAKWTAKADKPVAKYSATFDSKGGSTVAKEENLESGAKVKEPTAPEKEGYDFAGWYKTDPETDANAVAWNFETDTVTENVTLYAKWTVKVAVDKYTVTFDSKGGSAVAKEENLENGAKVNEPTAPEKEGYDFAGWYKTDPETDEKAVAWNFEIDTVTENVTLYAKWTVKVAVDKYTVTFDSKGGSAVAKEENLENGAKVNEPTAPEKEGYDFAGWYKTDPETDEKAVAWNFETDTVTENVTLYAKWTEVVAAPVATLVYGNGQENGTLTAVKDGDKYYYDRPTDPEKDYNTFDDWYTDAEFKTPYIWNTEAVDGLILYANYNQKYDDIRSPFDFAEASKVIGATATSEEKTVGRFTCAAGVRIDGGTTLNSQGKDITFSLKGEGTGNGITINATWASSTKVGSFFITNVKTGEIVYQKDNLKNKDEISFDNQNLPAGDYKISSGASLKITALVITEKLPQGPTNGIELDVTSIQTQYLAGREFSPNGLVVYLAYENGRKDEIEAAKYSLSPVDMTKAGKQTITVTYNKDANTPYTKTFDIYVYAIEELVVYTHVLDGKRITHNAQTLFALNGQLNSNNIAVKAKCPLEKAKPEDPQEYIEFVLTDTEYTVQPLELTTVGQKSVQIVYNADDTKVANYNIEVVEIPDYSTETFVNVAVDPTHELGVGEFGPEGAKQNCFYVHTINQALEFFTLAQVQESAQKGIGLKESTIYHEKIEINMPNVSMATIDFTTGKPIEAPIDPETGKPIDVSDKYAVIEFDGINGQLDPSDTIAYETSGSATVSIRSTATNFQVKAVKFNNYWNTAERYAESLKIYGNSKTQAVAVLVEADKVTFANCHFSSYQDTLYARKGRQYYYQCYIEGHTDYIFGDDATAVFEDCDIMTIGNDDENNGGYVVATKGKTSGDKELKYGYVFDNCRFKADTLTKPGTTSLGRAWAAGMSMMVMNSELGAHLSKEAYGDTTSPKNDRYGNLSANPTAALILEYKNTGDGAIDAAADNTYLANTCTILKDTDAQVAEYTATNKLNKFFGADNGSVQYDDVWMPAGYGEMDAIINLVDQEGKTVQTINGASYVGSTITESMLASKVQKIEGKTIVGYFSDQGCTTPYDYNTVLAETNTIYVKVVEGVVTDTEEFTASSTGYTAAVGTDGKAAGTDLKSHPYDGETFKVECSGGSKVATTGVTVTATDGSNLTFTTAFVPTGGGRIYTITAKRDVTIKVYYTISNTTGPMSTTAVEKDGNLTVNGASVETGGADQKYSTGTVYVYTITLKATESVTLTSSISNLCLFGVVAEYAL